MQVIVVQVVVEVSSCSWGYAGPAAAPSDGCPSRCSACRGSSPGFPTSCRRLCLLSAQTQPETTSLHYRYYTYIPTNFSTIKYNRITLFKTCLNSKIVSVQLHYKFGYKDIQQK